MTPTLARPLAGYLDHTLLRPATSEDEIRRVVEEAARFQVAAVCIPPVYVEMAARSLQGTPVRVGTVVAFPLGYAEPAIRLEEGRLAVARGARELDTVLNLSWLRSGRDGEVLEDLQGWVRELRQVQADLTLKVIVETVLLSRQEKMRAARLVAASGADFVKTSTGFAGGGATVEDVELLRQAVEGRVRVKASGGIRDLETALALIAAGADRLGTSSGAAILEEARRRGLEI